MFLQSDTWQRRQLMREFHWKVPKPPLWHQLLTLTGIWIANFCSRYLSSKEFLSHWRHYNGPICSHNFIDQSVTSASKSLSPKDFGGGILLFRRRTMLSKQMLNLHQSLINVVLFWILCVRAE